MDLTESGLKILGDMVPHRHPQRRNNSPRIFRFGRWVAIHTWSEEDDIILRRDYRHSVQSLRDLGYKFGVSENAIRGRLSRLGLLRSAVRWTPEEEEFLAEHYTNMSPRIMSERLHKSINSVTGKASRLGVSSKGRSGWFTKQEAARILGADAGWIDRRIDKFEIKPHDPEKQPKQGGYAPWHISEESLRNFIRRYPEELTGRNVDFVMLVEILAGIEGGR